MGRRANIKRISAPEGQAYCNRCDTYKDLAEFTRNKDNETGVHWYCRSCVKTYGSKYRQRLAVQRRYVRYGIDADAYTTLLEAQGHVCAICGQPETRIHKGVLAYLSVDHDHRTGQVRGLLCFACNHGLGLFRDDPVVLRTAAAYLEGQKKID